MSALGDIIIDALQDLLRVLFSPITDVIQNYGNELLDIVVGTPYPNAVFDRPTNGAWPAMYEYYWESIIPLALFLWAVSLGLVIFLNATSTLFGSYHRSKLQKRAFAGLLGILAWWWIAGLSLRFTHALTGFLVPDLSSITVFQTLSFTAMGALGLVVTLATSFVLFVLIAVIYMMRQVVLYLFVLLMPVLIVFWIPGVGPFTLVSGFMRRLAGFYVPFLFMTVPVAVLFRLGELLGQSFGFSTEGIGAWLIGLVIPIVAVVAPFILIWQAGDVFFKADRTARHVSGRRARQRATATTQAGHTTLHRGRNFTRGLQGHSAIQDDGTRTFGSGDSRANRAGFRVRTRIKESTRTVSTRMGRKSTRSSADDAEEFGVLRSRTQDTPSQSEPRQRDQENRQHTSESDVGGTSRRGDDDNAAGREDGS